MRYIKTFENYHTIEYINLFNHIKYFFDNLKGDYETMVMSDIRDFSFGVVKFAFNNFKLYKMFRILPLTDKDDEFFTIYKYEEYLNYYLDKNELYIVNFIISIIELYNENGMISIDKIPEIIENINNDSFKANLDENKYNL